MAVPAGRSRKRECADPGFVEEHRCRADAWVSECVPKSWVIEQPLPIWLQLKRDKERQRKTREKTFQNLPTMPFDMWFEMKKAALAEEADEAGEDDLRRHYQNLGQHRRGRLAAKKHATKPCGGMSSRPSRRVRRTVANEMDYSERNTPESVGDMPAY